MQELCCLFEQQVSSLDRLFDLQYVYCIADRYSQDLRAYIPPAFLSVRPDYIPENRNPPEYAALKIWRVAVSGKEDTDLAYIAFGNSVAMRDNNSDCQDFFSAGQKLPDRRKGAVKL